MSDESRRIAILTGGNANLLNVLGDILTSDGIQAVRLPRGTDGQVLTVDDLAAEGLSWQPSGGGGALTASDGVTRTLDNITNDLVTGVDVAQLNVDSLGVATINTAAGAISLTSVGGAINLLSTTHSVDIVSDVSNVVISAALSVNLTADGVGGMNLLTTDPAGPIDITSGGDMQLVSVAGNLNLQATAGNVNIASLAAASSIGISNSGVAGSSIALTSGGNVDITAGAGAGTGTVTLIGDADVSINGTDDVLLTAGDDIVMAFDELVFQAPGANNVILTASAAGDWALATVGEGVFFQRSAAGTLTIEGAQVGAQRLILVSDPAGLLAFYGHPTGADQAAAIADAAGGAVIDAEGRVATNAILAALRAIGLIAT